MSFPSLHVEIDKVDKNVWDNLITHFDDASIFQTWSYGSSVGKSNVSHIVLKSGNDVLGCCQVSLRGLPFYKIGLADIKWGPLCLKNGKSFSPDVLIYLIRGIKDEYALKRGYLVRIWPHDIDDRKELLKQILDSEGFKRNLSERPYRTLKLDITQPLDKIRDNLLSNWRNHLNKAEKSDLHVRQGTDDELFNTAIMLAKEMELRKDLKSIAVSHEYYRSIQNLLPDPLKMQVMICEANNEPVCAAICTVVGDTGIYLLGASAQKALKLNASYLLQW